MPKLVFTQPEFANQSCELRDGAFTVGRSRRNLIIIDEESVSGEHAQLLVYGREVIVCDRGARNGIFVNGARVQAQSGVNHGQCIRFGNVEVRLDLGPIEQEDSSDITAIHEFRRFQKDAGGSPEGAPLFPVTVVTRTL